MTLALLQRRMAAAVMQPLTTGSRIARTTSDGMVMQKEAAEFIKPNARLKLISNQDGILGGFMLWSRPGEVKTG